MGNHLKCFTSTKEEQYVYAFDYQFNTFRPVAGDTITLTEKEMEMINTDVDLWVIAGTNWFEDTLQVFILPVLKPEEEEPGG